MLKYCVVQLAALLSALSLIGVQLVSAHMLKTNYQRREGALVRSVARLRDDIHYAHHQEVRLNNNFSIWQELYNNHVYHGNDQAEQVSLETMIKQLSLVHKVHAEDITTSDTVDVSGSYRKKYIRVENSRVSIKFSALTDKHAVLFMQAIRYDVPGFVSIRLFEVTKEREITGDIVRAHEEGRVLPTVSGTIVFELYRITGRHT
ncbi:hypothetical protein [Candidatus Anaplasma sp. TIGMIC]|uniref:hypothetical protein n=1 Tax=Candidatus Anaplasma sp. TIGMIC TaxID=3020713 RepID=UPI00232AB935|nr:hypothetical protein [Candidatus Anaplasma sp. TIGMIC]MDB1135753.1 hypothetical protein [Candidatus Anaplasma sp. TIGMIC]